ncbi:MAG TPA: universal stress protein [Cyclobacteriaceae bacterium]|nr:universal stress protein [Cyclobacteriaceae bacterium]HMV10341.1 universal stress protein [Cyclobacteriaceae bacterium]HMV89869.1 universal stress protein [Cyclobacteriaceae bacterium]HMX02752.1 universal stress protein [Cyclobacteriaceae bacterium]HMX50094.1 universal stress protein [Cyclobacteriaceae bacterium]
MKKILVPTDFSKPAQIAVDVAADIAKKAGAEITFLHVIEEVTGGSFNVEGQMDLDGSMEEKLFTMALIKKSKKQMEALLNSPQLAGVKVRSQLRVGTPFHGMRTIITENKVDLVVMGTAGHSQMQEMIIGTNTEKVVRHAKCPVLTVQKKPSKTEFKNIVYATALSKDEEPFAAVLKEMQGLYEDSVVHLVRVNTPGNFQRDVVVKKQMQEFAKKQMLKKYTINIFNDLREEEGIIYFADSINADMIAMATHGRTGFAHVLAGSIAEDVVGHSKRPVLTYVIKK